MRTPKVWEVAQLTMAIGFLTTLGCMVVAISLFSFGGTEPPWLLKCAALTLGVGFTSLIAFMVSFK